MSLAKSCRYAEYVTAPQGLAMPLPQQFDYVQGAAIPEVISSNLIVRQSCACKARGQYQRTPLPI